MPDQILIDNSLFIFQCITMGNNQNPEFTYRTSEKWISKSIKEYFDFLKKIAEVKNFQNEIVNTKNNYYHWHSIKGEKEVNLIGEIFRYLGNNEQWIDSYISTAPLPNKIW